MIYRFIHIWSSHLSLNLIYIKWCWVCIICSNTSINMGKAPFSLPTSQGCCVHRDAEGYNQFCCMRRQNEDPHQKADDNSASGGHWERHMEGRLDNNTQQNCLVCSRSFGLCQISLSRLEQTESIFCKGLFTRWPSAGSLSKEAIDQSGHFVWPQARSNHHN